MEPREVYYILIFQAGLTITEVVFDEKENEKLMKSRHRWLMSVDNTTEPLNIPTDEPEALRMEHFLLPLGLWMVGILISLLFFIAEIIKHRFGGH